jgi:Predicted 3'-5' exonuclease related to the exonuclease domain of PolB
MAEHYVTQNGGRIITLDIETVSTDPTDRRGALGAGGDDAAPGEKSQIIIAGMLIDDGRQLTAAPAIDLEERRVLDKFWSTLRPEDTLVGHNIREFDIARIKQRSWILGVRPSIDLNLAKYRATNVVDVMELWTNWGQSKGCKLDHIARALGVGRKSGDSADLEAMWRAGRHKDVLDHCMEHVYLTYLIYCRMHYRDPLPFNLPKPASPAGLPQPDFTAPLAASIAAANAQREPVPVPVRPTPAALPFEAPRYVNEDASGRYGYKSDGRGGLIPTMPERSSPVVGFAAATPSPVAEKPQYGGKGRSRSKRVFYAVNGDRLVLNGGTFAIKDSLKAMGARPTGEGQTFAWELPAEKFDALAGLCARAGLALVPAQREAA